MAEGPSSSKIRQETGGLFGPKPGLLGVGRGTGACFRSAPVMCKIVHDLFGFRVPVEGQSEDGIAQNRDLALARLFAESQAVPCCSLLVVDPGVRRSQAIS